MARGGSQFALCPSGCAVAQVGTLSGSSWRENIRRRVLSGQGIVDLLRSTGRRGLRINRLEGVGCIASLGRSEEQFPCSSIDKIRFSGETGAMVGLGFFSGDGRTFRTGEM
jgi:hypothetical protein